MLLNRDNLDGTRSIYKYDGNDLTQSIQQVIDDNQLYNLYVNMTGDEMSGPLTIDVNTQEINPENLLCLDVDGKAEISQVVIDPTNNDALHISLHFKGNRDHQIFYENHLNFTERLVGEEGSIDDLLILQLDRGSSHIASNFNIGQSASFPNIELKLDGSATFQGKILLADITELGYNDAAHVGYVDSSLEVLRSEVLDYVEVDIAQEVTYINQNVQTIIGLGTFTYNSSASAKVYASYDRTLDQEFEISNWQGTAQPGELMFEFEQQSQLAEEDREQTWPLLQAVYVSETTALGTTLRNEVFVESYIINFEDRQVDSNRAIAAYSIVSISDKVAGQYRIELRFEEEFEILGEGEDPNTNFPPPSDTSPYNIYTYESRNIGFIEPGNYIWELIDNAVDGDGNFIEDFRAVNKLLFTEFPEQPNNLPLLVTDLPVGGNIEIGARKSDGGVIDNCVMEIIGSAEIISYEQINQQTFETEYINMISVPVDFITPGTDIATIEGAIYDFRILSTQSLKEKSELDDRKLESAIEKNAGDIEQIKSDLVSIERSFSRGRLKYKSNFGTAVIQSFSLNSASQSVNNFSNPNIQKIFLHEIDSNNDFQVWIPDGYSYEGTAIRFQNADPDKFDFGQYNIVAEPIYRGDDSVYELTVELSGGSDIDIVVDTVYDVKIISSNEGISASDANNTYVVKTGDTKLTGIFQISKENNESVVRIDAPQDLIVFGNVEDSVATRISFNSHETKILSGLIDTLKFDAQGIDVYKEVNLNDKKITGLPEAADINGTDAASVQYVQNYVDRTADTIPPLPATDSRLGGFKLSPMIYFNEDNQLKVKRAQTGTTASAEKSGVATFHPDHFEIQVSADGNQSLVLPHTASNTKFGQVKLDGSSIKQTGGVIFVNLNPKSMKLTDSKVDVKLADSSIRSGDNGLFVPTATADAKGIVKLSSSYTDSSSGTGSGIAATPHAVEKAYNRDQRGRPVIKSGTSGISAGGFYYNGGALYFKTP